MSKNTLKKPAQIRDAEGNYICTDSFYIKRLDSKHVPEYQRNQIYYVADISKTRVEVEFPNSANKSFFWPLDFASSFFSTAKRVSLTEAREIAQETNGDLNWYYDTISEFKLKPERLHKAYLS